MSSAFWYLFVLLNTNQYNTNTIGKKRAKDKELKNIKNYNGIYFDACFTLETNQISLNCF